MMIGVVKRITNLLAVPPVSRTKFWEHLQVHRWLYTQKIRGYMLSWQKILTEYSDILETAVRADEFIQ